MRRVHAHALLLAVSLLFAPLLAHAQSSDPVMSTSSSSSPDQGSAGPASDSASTAEFIVSPFEATQTGVVTTSDFTTQQLLMTVSQFAAVLIVILIIAVVLAAIGIGIYLTIRTASANEQAFRHFLRKNRVAMMQQVVAGHGPVLRDFAALFEIHDAYPQLARLVRENHATILPLLEPDSIQGAGPVRLARETIALGLRSEPIVREWLDDGIIRLRWSI